jgi:hypothetical protein
MTDMANRLFELPECKGAFQVKGIINGVEKEKFYTSKKTKNGKDFRAVNFGCMYDDKKTVYMSLNGMPQDNVYFSKRNTDTGKTETKKVAWANRNSFNENGFRMIGTNLGLVKTTDADGKEVNDKKTMHSFDACKYIKENLTDDSSTFIRGNIEFSSYQDNEGNTRRSIKYVPNQVSLCKAVDFEEYDEDNKPVHDFTQTIMFMGIDKEQEDNKDTGRFVVSAKIVSYADIVDTEFIITDKKLAGLFKKNLKPYNSISVHGKIEVSHKVEEVQDDTGWGETNSMTAVSAPTKTEMIITGATPSSIDCETYTEKNVSEAIAKIRNAKKAEQNFGSNVSASDSDNAWGDDDLDEDDPW